MKKKIGFIDWFIDEFHANCYVKCFRESALGKEFEVAMAWEDHANPQGRALKEWCAANHVTPARGIAEVVEACDVLCVLAPSNPETHEILARLPLQSGKPVYVDKPFTTNRESAERMFALAEQHNTPLWSSSALRFSDEIICLRSETFQNKRIDFAQALGGGRLFSEYCIHTLEMIVMLLGSDPRRVMSVGKSPDEMVVIEYPDGRRGMITQTPPAAFGLNCRAGDQMVSLLRTESRMFENLSDEILRFFATGQAPVEPRETIAVTALTAAAVKAVQTPETWIEL